jgi:hypothetical protein
MVIYGSKLEIEGHIENGDLYEKTDVKEEITERIPTGGKCLRKKNNQRITNL